MKDLVIKETEKTPSVALSTNGVLKIEGRSIPEDAARFFKPLLDWTKEFTSNEIRVDIKLEYFNTSSSKFILEMLRLLENNPENSNILVNWFYEEGDLDVLESGQYFESIIGIPFKYIEYEEL
jgi:SiaC family regulatory phosphoprotein